MTPQEAVNWARTHFDADAVGAARLTGGLMNEVWRIEGNPMSVVKIYSDRSVDNPGVELTPDRSRFEAAALQVVEHDDDLSHTLRPDVRVPRLLHFEPNEAIVGMTHLHHYSDFGDALIAGKVGDDAAAKLGTWVGGLHRETRHRMDLLRKFKNVAVQRTRLRVQYATVEDVLEDAEVPVEPTRLREAGRRALALGRALMEPGECLVMGDLWPRSVLVGDDALGVIDWEFAHFGRPLQDVAHMAAHLWLIADSTRDRMVSFRVHNARSAFLEAYFRATYAWSEEEFEGADVHAGCEIVMRTYGAFADGNLFADDTRRLAAAARGIDAMMGDWSPLHP